MFTPQRTQVVHKVDFLSLREKLEGGARLITEQLILKCLIKYYWLFYWAVVGTGAAEQSLSGRHLCAVEPDADREMDQCPRVAGRPVRPTGWLTAQEPPSPQEFTMAGGPVGLRSPPMEVPRCYARRACETR